MTGFEVHEVLLSRGDVRDAPFAVRVGIHSYYNCVAVHRACHIDAEGEPFKSQCASVLIKEDRPEAIVWLAAMDEYMKGRQAQHAIRYILNLIGSDAVLSSTASAYLQRGQYFRV